MEVEKDCGHEITRKENLNSGDYLIEVRAPLVAAKFKPGNFVIFLLHENGERIPMSIQKADGDRITVFFKRLGKTSRELDSWRVGDCIASVVGPLGNAIEIKKYGNVVVASDLVCGHAENYAAVKALKEAGNHVISMESFPTKDDIYPEEELSNMADEYYLTTADGSKGAKGHYTDVLKGLLDENKVDMVFAGGDIPSLGKLSELTRGYNVPTMVTLRQIMVDGTGMCGACRVFIDGEMKLTCVDGPMFDGHKVNFQEVASRLGTFKEEESASMDDYNCRGVCHERK